MTNNQEHKHLCFQNDKIVHIQEDLTTIKAQFNAKEKSNGELKKELEGKDETLAETVQGIKETVIRIEEKQNVQDRIIAMLFAVFLGALALITII